MKRTSIWIALAACACLSACATHQPPKPEAKPPQPELFAGAPCAGETSAILAELLEELPDPERPAVELELARIARQGLASARLRNYLRCVARRGVD